MRSTRVLFALLLFGCASHRPPLLPGHYAVQFDPADASSTVTAISYANSIDEALESAFRARMEHVDFSSIISAADAYDAVVSVDVYFPRKWSTAAPSHIPGTSSLPPGYPIPVLRYRIDRGRSQISSGSVALDLPQWPPLEGTDVDFVFRSAAEQLAT